CKRNCVRLANAWAGCGRLLRCQGVNPRAVVGGIEIDEARATRSMQFREPGHFLAGNRMPDEHYLLEPERIERRRNVRDGSGEIARRRRARRSTEPATGDTNHVEAIRELRGEQVEDVGRVANASEENERATATAPVQHLERYAATD